MMRIYADCLMLPAFVAVQNRGWCPDTQIHDYTTIGETTHAKEIPDPCFTNDARQCDLRPG
ncbi:MAG: hypothetical protein OHK0046_41570 [Anaerolineae bacterium]